MIKEFGNPTVEKLMGSEFDFYLTGSRYFGAITSSSDWDFFAADLPKIVDFLTALGFKPISASMYIASSDSIHPQDIKVIYEHASDGVHVQLVKNPETKCIIQKSMKESGVGKVLHLLPRERRKLIWNFAYILFEKGGEHAINKYATLRAGRETKQA